MALGTKNFLIQPLKVYFLSFLFTGLVLLLFLNWSLYNEGQKIQQTVHKQAQVEAKKEMTAIFKKTLSELRHSLKALSEWDEVHQQLEDSSYYFYWHDDRLKESQYFNKHYDQVEIYNRQKTLLAPSSLEKISHKTLPLTIRSLTPTIVLTKNRETHLNLFEPIYSRSTEQILGYIGVSLDLLPYLQDENTFYHVDKRTLSFSGKGDIPLSQIMEQVRYQPIANPVTDYLWQLIQKFILQLIILLLVTSILLSMIFNKLFYHPLEIISQYLNRLKINPKEPQQLPQKTFYLREFQELQASIHNYHRDLQVTQQALDNQNQTVWDQARRDVLTNIYNRRAFDEAWNELLMNLPHDKVSTGFMLFDCDFFKALNDTYGHEIGDKVIRTCALTIQQALPMDCPPYRIGGDEFAVILQNKNIEQIIAVAEKCLHALRNYNFSSIGIKEKLSFSVGISYVSPGESTDFTNDIASLPRQADIAMYKAKQSHQDKVQCYHHQLESQAHALVSNETVNTVVNAIHTGENIEMHFQPIQSIKTGAVYFESLIRIQNNNKLIYPNDIFAVVQRRRLEVELDTQVIQAILRMVIAGKLPKETGVAINISGKTLLQPGFTSLFADFIPYLKSFKVVIEVTENILIDHMEYAQTVLNELRQQGFLIALDDFGSGYSSIRYLAHMPVDIIKFDMSMTHALKADHKTKNIIKSTAEMVLRSGYDLVMEGIEDQEMYDNAQEAGATHLQGYLLGKPNITPTLPKHG
ncbi:EAL domain-containing protein [Thiomicrorhabdus arctica]|uniref:EAL domain-containing protein n=1 Tax=Thiomicrorhabdus arctica TaxID=131540 RepID=UPI0003609994|nr:EAL domain-containing protein [Thiomicrorhabdus arctica]